MRKRGVKNTAIRAKRDEEVEEGCRVKVKMRNFLKYKKLVDKKGRNYLNAIKRGKKEEKKIRKKM